MRYDSPQWQAWFDANRPDDTQEHSAHCLASMTFAMLAESGITFHGSRLVQLFLDVRWGLLFRLRQIDQLDESGGFDWNKLAAMNPAYV